MAQEKKTPLQWYPRFPGDYMRDTGHLTLAEDGAYNRLLDHYYASRKPLPNDPNALIRICRAFTPDEQDAVESVTSQFFSVGDDGKLHNNRADEEIAKQSSRSESARRSAEQRWNSDGNANAMRTQCDGNADHNHIHNHIHIPEEHPQQKNGKVSLPFDSSEFIEAWNAFKEHRRKLKKPMTDRAQTLALKKLPDSEPEAIRWIDNAIEKGWIGIYEPKDNRYMKTSPAPVAGPSRQDILEQ